MVEHVWPLTNASVLLDSQEATVRKVTLRVLLFVGVGSGDRVTSRENGSLSGYNAAG